MATLDMGGRWDEKGALRDVLARTVVVISFRYL